MLYLFLFLNILVSTEDQETEKLLAGKWSFSQYKVANTFYSPLPKEYDDYIYFYNDRRFISSSQKKIEKGLWKLYNKEQKIIFTDTNNQSLTAIIHSLDQKNLVLEYKVKELKSILFYYKRNK